jgi:hypothetical protein
MDHPPRSSEQSTVPDFSLSASFLTDTMNLQQVFGEQSHSSSGPN